MPEYEMERRLFTDDEKVAMAERAAQIHQEVSILESEQKNMKSNYKAKIDKLISEGKELMWKIHDGYEMVHPEQSELPGFSEADAGELADAIDDGESE